MLVGHKPTLGVLGTGSAQSETMIETGWLVFELELVCLKRICTACIEGPIYRAKLLPWLSYLIMNEAFQQVTLDALNSHINLKAGRLV